MFSWTMLISGNKLAEQVQRFVSSILPRPAQTEDKLTEDPKDLDPNQSLTS